MRKKIILFKKHRKQLPALKLQEMKPYKKKTKDLLTR